MHGSIGNKERKVSMVLPRLKAALAATGQFASVAPSDVTQHENFPWKFAISGVPHQAITLQALAEP